MSTPEADPADRAGAGDEPGLPWLATPLRRTLETQQAHALLIHGPGGVGQFELALALAKGWLCEATDRPLVDRPCGRCASCKLHAAHSHPDLLVLVPEALREAPGRIVRIDSARDKAAVQAQIEAALGALEVRLG